jgi:hypothetical protein
LPFLTQVIVFRTFLTLGDGEATGEFEGAGVGAVDATAAVVGNLLMS